jgi:hypothetical protein
VDVKSRYAPLWALDVGRLIAQFLTESLVIAGLGAVAGLALAVPAMRFLEQLVPESMGATRLTLDWRVLVFATVASVAAALAFGLAPALRGSRLSPQDGLRDGGRGTAGVRSHWFQHSLIVVETALAVALLTCGDLLLQSFQHLWNTDLGIRTKRLLTFETPLLHYKDFDRRVAFVNAELEKVRAIPGVTPGNSRPNTAGMPATSAGKSAVDPVSELRRDFRTEDARHSEVETGRSPVSHPLEGHRNG